MRSMRGFRRVNRSTGTLGATCSPAVAAATRRVLTPALSIVGDMYKVAQLGNTYLTQINPKGQGVKSDGSIESMICVKSNCPTPWEGEWDWEENIGPNKARCSIDGGDGVQVPTPDRVTGYQANPPLFP